MKFNLRKYLTEKLQSDIIVNEILNEPGGLFKVLQCLYDSNSIDRFSPNSNQKNNHLVDRISSLYRELESIINTLFMERWDQKTSSYTINKKTRSFGDPPYEDEKYIKANNIYLKKYNEYIKLVKRLVTEPHIEALSYYLNKNNSTYSNEYAKQFEVNLANITDNMFIKYTYAEIKKDKILYDSISNDGDLSNRPIFWFNKDKVLLGITKNGEGKMISCQRLLNSFGFNNSIEDLQKIFNNEDNIKRFDYTQTLDDGHELTWPIVGDQLDMVERSTRAKPLYIKTFIEKMGLHSSSSRARQIEFNIGRFLTKKSNLYKEIGWGNSPEDYIIIYNWDKSASYINLKLSYTNNTRRAHRKDIELYINTKYKWLRDIFGDTIAYNGTKREKTLVTYKFMEKMRSSMVSSMFKSDDFCKRAYEINKRKYEILKTLNQSVKTYNDTIKTKTDSIFNEITQYVDFSCEVQGYMEILCKNTNKVDQLHLLDISILFGTYSAALNETMILNTQLLKYIEEYNNAVNDSRTEISKMDMSYDTNAYYSGNTYQMNNATTAVQKHITTMLSSLSKLNNAMINLRKLINKTEDNNE